jgi:hypothetical protein
MGKRIVFLGFLSCLLAVLLSGCGMFFTEPKSLKAVESGVAVALSIGDGGDTSSRGLLQDSAITTVAIEATGAGGNTVGAGTLHKGAAYWSGFISVSELGIITFKATAMDAGGAVLYYGEAAVTIIGSADSVIIPVSGEKPAAVQKPAVSSADGSLTVGWEPVTGATSYEVYFNTMEDPSGATRSGGDLSAPDWTITGLANYQAYFIWVRAKNPIGAGGFSPSARSAPLPVGVGATLRTQLDKAYLDIPNAVIHGADVLMDYSLDNGATWTACQGAEQAVSLAAGSRVLLRDRLDNIRYLGEVKSLSGPDLFPGSFLHVGTGWFSDKIYGVPGETLKIYSRIGNIGSAACYSASLHFRYYLSTDRAITESDYLLLDIAYPYSCGVGSVYICGYDAAAQFTVPSLPPGAYYIGCIADPTAVIAEANEDNNTTSPGDVTEFTILDPAAPAAGAFKIVNSWGQGGWEHVADGHYWIPFDVMKSYRMGVYYYANDFSHAYKPTVVALFKLTHPIRSDCQVFVGLGSPDNPHIIKSFNDSDTGDTGAVPFPNNSIAFDISELAGALNDYDLFLRVTNTGATAGSIDAFSVELYSDYDQPPFKVITGGTAVIPASADTSVTAPTHGALTPSERMWIIPAPRNMVGGFTLVEDTPSEAELQADMNAVGIFDPSKRYAELYRGAYRTGAFPPSEAQWRQMKKLRAVRAPSANGEGGGPGSIDLSQTPYFPPIGDQGTKGTCTTFSVGYYIETYTEAKEHGWDLSGTRWVYPDPAGLSNAGAPNGNLDKIFSPDFIYNQINWGVDNGAFQGHAASLIIRVGGAPWAFMPYNTGDWTSWPGEAAWRAAARYRGRGVGNWSESDSGYFVVQTNADIRLLQALLASDYCVSTTIYASTIFNNLSPVDVAVQSTPWSQINHAQTVVGYKEGAAWDPADPER